MPRPQFSIRTLLSPTLVVAAFLVAFYAQNIFPHRGEKSVGDEEFHFFCFGEPRDNCPAIFVERPSSKKFLTRWPIHMERIDLAWAASDQE